MKFKVGDVIRLKGKLGGNYNYSLVTGVLRNDDITMNDYFNRDFPYNTNIVDKSRFYELYSKAMTWERKCSK